MYINERNNRLLQRLTNIIDNRNFHIFQNEFHKEIRLEDEENLKKQIKRNLYLVRTVEYFFSHFSQFSNDFRIIVLSNKEVKTFYSERLNNLKHSLQIMTLAEFAIEEMKDSPVLYNYITNFEEVKYISSNDSDVEVLEASSSTNNNDILSHLTESEMKKEI
jgi:hypothetical protein